MGRAKPLIAQSGISFKNQRADAHRTYKTGGKLTKKRTKCGKKCK